MLQLYRDPHSAFRFAGDRVIPRLHLEGVEAGRRVSAFGIDPAAGGRLGLLAAAGVGEGGWVDPTEPIIVRAGDAFVAAPDSPPWAARRKPARPPGAGRAAGVTP